MSTLHPDLATRAPILDALPPHPRPTFGPHWFSMAMGTAMIAIALSSLPGNLPGRAMTASAFWGLSAILLLVLTVVALRELRRSPGSLRTHLADPALGHFFGAPAIAVLSVGAATLLAGHRVLGLHLAIAVNGVLWSLGTLLALATAVLLPVVAITRHEYDDTSGHHPPAVGAWLLPLVGPLVSASTGALLVPHLGNEQARETLLLGSYALAGASVITCLVTFAHLWGSLLRHGPGPAMAAPLLWIPLGFLGQSVTAFGHLADSSTVVPATADLASAFDAFGVIYGLPVWGCALAWLAIAVALTAHAARRGLRFSLSWWSFTFPLGTVVTASAALEHNTGLSVFGAVAGVLMAALLAVWVVVATGTVRLLARKPRAQLGQAG